MSVREQFKKAIINVSHYLPKSKQARYVPLLTITTRKGSKSISTAATNFLQVIRLDFEQLKCKTKTAVKINIQMAHLAIIMKIYNNYNFCEVNALHINKKLC